MTFGTLPELTDDVNVIGCEKREIEIAPASASWHWDHFCVCASTSTYGSLTNSGVDGVCGVYVGGVCGVCYVCV